MSSSEQASPRKNTEVENFTNELRRKRDELLAPHYFQELLELAQETCLTSPEALQAPDIAPHLSGEALLVATIGSRGLKGALEIELGAVKPEPSTKQYENEEAETAAERLISVATPMRFPDDFNNSTNYDILAAAEAFGDQLIRESFKTLGQDAYEKADAFKNAASAEEQMAIIEWLEKRLREMITEKENPANAPTEKHYHPARLSPKLIGVYPNNLVPPTCLSVSVIATSFFKRAGVSAVLHGDVMRTSIEDAAVGTGMLVEDVRHYTELLGVTLSDPMEEALTTMRKQVHDYVRRPEAHHAAVYARLVDGSWAQFDSNYHSSVRLNTTEHTANLDDYWNTLTSFAQTAPNMELSAKLAGPDFLDIPSAAYYVVKSQTPQTIEALTHAVHMELENNSDEPFGEAIFELISKHFFGTSDIQDDETLTFITDVLKEQQVITKEGHKESCLRNAFYRLFEKYVLWGEDPDTARAKMTADPHYRERRADDIIALPFLMSVVLSKDYFLDLFEERTPHRAVELGRPEQRIGLAVLSDFASHTNSPLSASFWLSHWPSGVPVLENLERAANSNTEDSFLFNNLVYHSVHPLTSYRNHDIIQKFIDIRTQSSPTES